MIGSTLDNGHSRDSSIYAMTNCSSNASESKLVTNGSDSRYKFPASARLDRFQLRLQDVQSSDIFLKDFDPFFKVPDLLFKVRDCCLTALDALLKVCNLRCPPCHRLLIRGQRISKLSDLAFQVPPSLGQRFNLAFV